MGIVSVLQNRKVLEMDGEGKKIKNKKEDTTAPRCRGEVLL